MDPDKFPLNLGPKLLSIIDTMTNTDPQQLLFRFTDYLIWYTVWIAVGVIIGLSIRLTLRFTRGHGRPSTFATALFFALTAGGAYVATWYHFGMIPILESFLWALSHATVLGLAVFWILRRWRRPSVAPKVDESKPTLLLESDDTREIEKRRQKLANRLEQSLDRDQSPRPLTSRLPGANDRIIVDAPPLRSAAKAEQDAEFPWLEGDGHSTFERPAPTREQIAATSQRPPARPRRDRITSTYQVQPAPRVGRGGGHVAAMSTILTPPRVEKNEMDHGRHGRNGTRPTGVVKHPAGEKVRPAGGGVRPAGGGANRSSSTSADKTSASSITSADDNRPNENRSNIKTGKAGRRSSHVVSTRSHVHHTDVAGGRVSVNQAAATKKSASGPTNRSSDLATPTPVSSDKATAGNVSKFNSELPSRTTPKDLPADDGATKRDPAVAPITLPSAKTVAPAEIETSTNLNRDPNGVGEDSIKRPDYEQNDNGTSTETVDSTHQIGVLNSPPLPLSKTALPMDEVDELDEPAPRVDENDGHNNFLNPTREASPNTGLDETEAPDNSAASRSNVTPSHRQLEPSITAIDTGAAAQDAMPENDDDTYFYELAWTEIQSGALQQALWAKAYASADGAQAKARAWYIRYRVAQLVTLRDNTIAPERILPTTQDDQRPTQKAAVPPTPSAVANDRALTTVDAIGDDAGETLNCKCCNHGLPTQEILSTGISTVACPSCNQLSDVYTVANEPILVKAHAHLTQSGTCFFCSDIGDTDAKLSDGAEYHESCYERVLLEFDELVEDVSADRRATATYRAALHRVYDHWPDFPPDWAIRRQGKINDKQRCELCNSRNSLELVHKTSLQRGGSNLPNNLELICRSCWEERQSNASRNSMQAERPGSG